MLLRCLAALGAFLRSVGFRRAALYTVGMAAAIGFPLFAVFEHFPGWLRDDGYTVSGVALILLILSLFPICRLLSRLLRSPAVWELWLCIWLFCLAMGGIIRDVEAVSFMGFIGGLAAALCFRLARYLSEEKKSGEDEE